ncbi:MAG TPA: diguanylate cyclase [Caldithrix abyssi]|uniref:diguanylate cyclase n=1 Tax=Caldithrix abyssi TaxID=187145 RepID=A0A7V5PMV6_CALAY|nr:diguanylate cyclase [Caldithrix abyssi]
MAEKQRKKILVIEDHSDMLMIIRKYLNENNLATIEAENAELGLKKFHEEQPDLVLMDLMLPGMSGLDAIRRIKREQKESDYVPIIIITAKNSIDDIVEGLDSGADDYVVKPFHFDELIARIRTALRLKELNELLVRQSQELEQANSKINKLNKTLLTKNRELRKNIYNLHSLFEISMELTSILELDQLVNSILLTLIGQFSCNNAIFLYAPKHDISRMEVINAKGYYENEVKNLLITKKDPLIDHFKTNNTPLDLTATNVNFATSSPAIESLKTLNIQLIAPVQIKDKVEGLICMGPRIKNLKYSKQDMEQISILSNIISISVANASLYHEVEQLSYKDGMTDLHNFRYFELRLKEEVVRHRRTKSGLTLLLLDVDNFKNYNDHMGHPAGDEVLRKLAQILKETVRENDIVARYGGEEFAVILPSIEKPGGVILAERIRENVEKTYFDHEEIQPGGKVTVSIGVASLPLDASDYHELMNKADIALYRAKNNGRNRVVPYSPEMENHNQL